MVSLSLETEPNFAEIVAVHLLLILLLTAGIWWAARVGEDVRYLGILTVMTAFLGPFGPGGTLFVMISREASKRRALSFKEWYASLFPEQESTFAEDIYDRIVATRQESTLGTKVIPFVDVLTTGSVPQKQTVISLVTKHFHPTLAPTLLRALQDEANAVRVQAASSMAQIENRFNVKEQELTKAFKERPSDENLMRELAAHFDEYAHTGLLDKTRESEYRGKALDLYRKLVEIEPGDEKLRLSIGRLLVRNEAYAEAIEWLQDLVHPGVDCQPRALMWMMECLYRLKRWSELKSLATRARLWMSARENIASGIRETIERWAETPVASVDNLLLGRDR